MFRTSQFILTVTIIVSVLFFQQFSCRPITNDEQNSKDKFAQEAADILDSTIWFFKDSLSHLIEDSSRINKMLMNVTDKLKRLTPAEKPN